MDTEETNQKWLEPRKKGLETWVRVSRLAPYPFVTPASQAECDTSIARVTGAYSREGYRSVTSLVMPGSTGPKTSALLCARKCITCINDDEDGHLGYYVCIQRVIIVSVNFWSGLLM